jgi:hypothetical protein
MDGQQFKIVDSEVGKTVGLYHTHEAAEAAFIRMYHSDPSQGEILVLVTMDEKGMPEKTEKPLLPSQGPSHFRDALSEAVRSVSRRRAVG